MLLSRDFGTTYGRLCLKQLLFTMLTTVLTKPNADRRQHLQAGGGGAECD